MVETRRQREYLAAYDEEQLHLALRQSRIESGQFKKGGSAKTSRTKQRSPELLKSKPCAKAKVVKAIRSTKKSSPRTVSNTRLKLCGIKYHALPYEMLSKWQAQGKFRPPKLPFDYWPYPNNPGIKLGHNAWQHLNWRGPREEDVRHVNTVLDRRHAEFEHKSYVDMPAHATQSVINVDVCIQTILAQSTGNEIAIDTHCRLRNTFTYERDGRRVAGKIPNWHAIRCLQREELEEALRQGGFHVVRARAIKEILDMVYAQNLERRHHGVQEFEHEGNPPDADDFVPGMLSLDFLSVEGDDSNEAVLGRLLDIPQIGLKSAMCIMAFAMKRELFPVDVHVLRMSKWLGWLPKDCDDPKKAAMFLHAYVPGPIMFNLHQAIWIHCANENTRISNSRDAICLLCGSSPPPKGTDVEKALLECPLTPLLPPLTNRWSRRYKPESFKREDQTTSDIIIEQQDIGTLGTDQFAAVIHKDEFDSSSEETLVNSETASIVSSLGEPALQSSSQGLERMQTLSSGTKRAKKVNFDKVTSLRFEDVPEEMIENVQKAGFLLWEFRPMDNSFMEEHGKFEKFPRYKWERPDIMDPEAAVTVEYAREVLAGKRRHRWSIVDVEEVATVQAMGLMDA